MKVSANVKIAMQRFENFGEGKLPPWLRAWARLYLFCLRPPSSFTYNSHIIKKRVFCVLYALSQFLCTSSKFRSINPGCLPPQQHAFSARTLFDETLAQPDIFAVVNFADVALSVSYSRLNVLMDICAVANCSVLVLSAVLLRSRNLERW